MKALFVHKLVYSYRVSFYEELARRLEGGLTIVHSGRAMLPVDGFAREIVVPEHAWGRLHWQTRLGPLVRDAEVVVALFDVQFLSSLWQFFRHARGRRWFWWGIGFGRSAWANRLRVFLAKRSDGVALYMPHNREAFLLAGVPPSRVCVVPNTVGVEDPFCVEDPAQRRSFLFLGSLKRRKRVDWLLEAFARVCPLLPKTVTLDILGDGECRGELTTLCGALGLSDRVTFHGAVTEEAALKPFFARALAMVSPGQAGLSVLRSFACGVPVVALANAVSGGELRNVVDNDNGLLCGPSGRAASLDDALLLLGRNAMEAVRMGRSAHRHYCASMTLGHLVDAFVDLIQQRG